MVQSVTRAIDLLLALEQGPETLGNLVRQTGLSKATVHRLLTSLSYRQLVIQDPVTSDYLLGPGCFGIGDSVMRGSGGLELIAGEVLEELRNETEETITLHVLAGRLRVCVWQLPSKNPIRYVARVGATRPLYLGAMGKVLLAFTSTGIRNQLLEGTSLDRVTDATITDRQELDQELERIREVGYAISRGENVVGAVALSTPVFGADDKLLASLSILGPEDRMSEAVVTAVVPALLSAAEEISALTKPASESASPNGKDDSDLTSLPEDYSPPVSTQ